MSRLLRQVLFWCHLACGVTAGAIILIMSATGVALTYQRQMQLWADTANFRAAPAAGTTRLPVAEIVARAAVDDPDAAAATVTLRADRAMPAAVSIGGTTIYVNPYTGHVYGEGEGQRMRRFFSSVVSWHRYVALAGESRPLGKALTGASNLVFLFIVLSGLYLWLPRAWTWAHVRAVVWFRQTSTSKARDFNWHHVIGLWSAIPLAVVVGSATVISYPWASNLVYRAAGETPPASAGRAGAPGPGAANAGGRGRGTNGTHGLNGTNGRGGTYGGGRAGAPSHAGAARVELPAAPLEAAVREASLRVPAWRMLTLRLPASAGGPIVVTVDEGDGGQPQRRGTLTIDARDGDAARWEPFASQTRGRRWRSWLRFAHTGEAYGLFGQTVAGAVSAAGVVLVWTGLALTWRRFTAWRHRGRSAA